MPKPFDPYAYAASLPESNGARPLESTGDADADVVIAGCWPWLAPASPSTPSAQAPADPVIAALSAGLPSSPELEFSWADDAECRRRAHAFAMWVRDYEATVNGTAAWRLSNHIEAYLRISAYGAQLTYYLAKHADLFVTISAARPADSIALLLNLERQLRSLEAAALTSAVPLQAVYSSDYAIVPTPKDDEAAAQVLQMLALDVAGAPAN